jgi:uncharacterized membrane protein
MRGSFIANRVLRCSGCAGGGEVLSLPLCSQVASRVSAHPPKLRSFRDRLRQIVLFEVGGMVLLTPPFAWASGVPFADSIGLLALLALLAALWNGAYNTGFDWIDGRLSGRCADRRPLSLRVLHAVGFEGGLLLMSLPVVMGWTGMGWLEAFVADIVLAGVYAVYAFGYNLAYDRVFPIEALGAEAIGHAD